MTAKKKKAPKKKAPKKKAPKKKAPKKKAPTRAAPTSNPKTKASHPVPTKTVFLGEPTDLWIRHGEMVTHYDRRDLKGFVMLTTPGAERLPKGRARLYLVQPRKINTSDGASFGPAGKTFRTWHQRNPEKTFHFDGVPDSMGRRLGRAVKIDYRSPKWGGKWTDYTHNFEDGVPPLAWSDKAVGGKARGFCLVGGTMRITSHGIE